MTAVRPPDANSRVASLIKPDKVHGSLYTDPAIFADELQKIPIRGSSSAASARRAPR
jgi:hypothetical protein